MTAGAIDGVRVVDIADHRGAYAGRVLADLGAEVIVVEPPGGSSLRRRPPHRQDDPDRSLYWETVAQGKCSLVVDAARPGDRARLDALIDHADILIDSTPPGEPPPFGLALDTIRDQRPTLIHVRISPWGRTGPNAGMPATDLTLEAAGGLLGMQGDPDRPPVPVGYPQAALHAGVQAAADALIALFARNRSGAGQVLDVSTHCAMVWTLMNATGYPPATGSDPPGFGAARSDPRPGLIPGARTARILPCADGQVVFGVHLPGVGERTMQGIVEWLAEEYPDAVDDTITAVDWRRWISSVREGTLPLATFNRAFDAFADVLARLERRQVFSAAVGRKLLIAPVWGVSDVLADPQLETRGYWRKVGQNLVPGPFACLSETPIEYRGPAPELNRQTGFTAHRSFVTPAAPTPPGAGAFDGLTVIDFAWVGVGPIISKALADHGADVIHVETRQRLDVLRQLPPFKDNVPGLNRSQFFANFNTSKRSIELNLSDANDLAVARELVAGADVVVESFSPGTLARYGLDYATLARPDLVMLSTCMRGQTGLERAYTGFGNQGAALAGLLAITGWPDRPPCGPWGAYTDFVAPRFGVAALTAALVHRQRTGRGQYVDLSQIEAGIHFLGPLVLASQVNDPEPGPVGHDSPYACPHGVYATRGTGRYVAIAIETDDQWRALTGLCPGLPGAAATCADRRALRAEIDPVLAGWLAGQDPFTVARRLTDAGVPAYTVLWPSDLYRDPQLTHRGFFVTLDHPEMGPMPYDGHATHFSATPPRLRRPGPCLGEHSDEIRTSMQPASEPG